MFFLFHHRSVGAAFLVSLAQAHLAVEFALRIVGSVSRGADGAARLVVLGAAVHAGAMSLAGLVQSTPLTILASKSAAGIGGAALWSIDRGSLIFWNFLAFFDFFYFFFLASHFAF